MAPRRVEFKDTVKRKSSSGRIFDFPPSRPQTRFRVNAMWATNVWNFGSRNGNIIKVNDQPGTYLKRHSARHRGFIFVLGYEIVVEMKLEIVLLRHDFD